MDMMTTKSILNQMHKGKKSKEVVEDPEREPILISSLKKGQKVEVFDNPRNKTSMSEGFAKLLKLNDANVYHEHKGYENWQVEFIETGDKADRIISTRHIQKE